MDEMILNLAMPVFYDCEASGLDGVPIEIGLAFVDDAGEVESEAHLVQPPADWEIEAVWDDSAEVLHRITLQVLRAHGKPVREVAARMSQALAGRELYADSPFDEAWLKQIVDAAGVEPTFALRRLNADYLVAQTAAKRGVTFDAYVASRDAMLAIPVHRAEPDARAWAELWRRFSH